MKFQVVVREDPEDGGYNVSCPVIPGCHSQGETVEEALDNIKDAIVACVEVHNEDLLRTKKLPGCGSDTLNSPRLPVISGGRFSYISSFESDPPT